MDCSLERAVDSFNVLFSPQRTRIRTAWVRTNLFEAGEDLPASNKFVAKQIRGLVPPNVSSLLGF